MGDLDNSPLLDRRHLEVLRSIIGGSPLAPISGVEQQFIKLTPLIKELNGAYDGRLIEKLDAYKHYTAVAVSIDFLIWARSKGQLEKAMEVLEVTLKEQRSGNLDSLKKVLLEARGVPAEWAVTLFAEDDVDRHDTKIYTMPSGLNLEAMRNFK